MALHLPVKGDIDGYAEGELFFPGSPIMTVSGTFAECVILETLILSVLNHDCAIAPRPPAWSPPPAAAA